MRILIIDPSEPRVDLRLPSALALNSVSALWIQKALQERGITLTRQQLLLLMRTLRKYKRKHPNWNLVEVEQADGKCIEIRL